MVLLDDSTAFHHPPSLRPGQRMASELSRLYCLDAREGADGSPRDFPSSPNQIRSNSKASGLSSDTSLPALAQLGIFRLECRWAFVTLVDRHETHIIAEASNPISVYPKHGGIGDFLGIQTLGLGMEGNLCVDTHNVTANNTRHIVRDLALEEDLQTNAFLACLSGARFYAEVPLYISSGDIFGTYCVVDDGARVVFDDSNVADLQEIANAIANHLENVWALSNYRRSDRLLNALMTIKGHPAAEEAGRKPKNRKTSENNKSQHSQSLDMRRLSISEKPKGDISPMSTRARIREDSNSSPFFQDDSPGPNSPTKKHQTHLRRCSDESNHLISVTEKVTPSPLTSLLFSRASLSLRESMDLDGVLFLDASRSNYRRFSSASVSDLDVNSKDEDPCAPLHSPGLSSHGAWSDQLCEPLGSSLSEPSNNRIFRLALTEGLLHDMFTSFPHGEIFYPNDSTKSHPVSLAGSRRHSLQSTEHEHLLHHAVTARLSHDFPEAKSLIFLPLWNWDKSRWLSSIIIWTQDNQRSLVENDLHYLKAFGDSVVSEFSQIGWTATEKSKSDLLSSMSHELRSPLHGMLASAELLQTTPLEAGQRDMVTMIETCGLTLLDTMNYLLDFTKINNLTNMKHIQKTGDGHQEVELDNLVSEFQLDTLVEDVAEALYSGHRSLINASRIAGRYLPSGTAVNSRTGGPEAEQPNDPDDLSIVVRIEEQHSWAIQSVSGGWRRIVMNLLGNAFKFTRSGLIEIFLGKHVVRADGSKSVFAHLSIKDTGCGISPEFLKHKLFKPFSQENILTEGVGLGLSIVQQLVTYLGGTVDVKSEIGLGTQVDVYIPSEFMEESSFPPPQIFGRSEGPGARTVTRVCLVGLNAYINLKEAPTGLLSTEAKRKLSIRSALSNVLLSQPGWMVSFADSLDQSSGDIGVIEESSLKKIAGNGHIDAKFQTIVVLGEHGVSLPENFAIKGADVIYLSQPLGPRKIIEAFQRFITSHHEASPCTESPISGPFSGFPTRGRSLSEAFALAKGTESPPVVRDNVTEYSPPTPDGTDRKGHHVLIVDDNDINIKILATFMRKIGCSYDTASNGLAALEKYKKCDGKFDYVLMDISMPIMDGIVSSSKIREYEEQNSLSRAPIMAVTGVASSGMQQQAFAAGIDDYLVKPLSLHDLKRIMNIT